MRFSETDPFTILIDRLRDGHREPIAGSVTADFLEVEEEELSFPHPVSFKGEAYLAEDHLIINLEASTDCQLPCSLCNERFTKPLHLPHLTLAIATEELRKPFYSFRDELRTALLLEVPSFAHCSSHND